MNVCVGGGGGGGVVGYTQHVIGYSTCMQALAKLFFS